MSARLSSSTSFGNSAARARIVETGEQGIGMTRPGARSQLASLSASWGVGGARCVGALAILWVAIGAPAVALDFHPYARGSFAALRQAHAGRPLLVHFWSVTCAPCLAELPDWGQLAAGKKGIDIVFVNVDGERDRAKAGAQLERAGLAGAAHYGFADDFLDRLFFEVDPAWRGELPFTVMIDASGKLVTATGLLEQPAIAGWLLQASP
jgi:thiol-disulfide isomerase/thioredoxin